MTPSGPARKLQLRGYTEFMKSILPHVLLSALFLTSCFDSSDSEETNVSAEAGAASEIGIVDVDAEKAAALVSEKPELVILDVRTPEEFAEGHLAGAVNIDFKEADFAAKVGELDPEKPYLLHCRSGSRSRQSMPVFEGLNFSEIYHLNTGYLGWTEAGKPVEK